MDTRLLILNAEPVFEDGVLTLIDSLRQFEMRIVRTLSEAVYNRMREDFDLFLVESETTVAIESGALRRRSAPAGTRFSRRSASSRAS
ncbi:MAG: hypothetical protein M3480_06210 [Verrucomicrobiota bacterium]|nr:hypothetical protein [Verrucomicrobiota bacterium]